MNNELIERIDHCLKYHHVPPLLSKVLISCKAALTQQQEAKPVVIYKDKRHYSATEMWGALAKPNLETPEGSLLYLHPPKPAALPADIDVDELSNFIRNIDGNNSMGAGALAENIVEWLEKQAAQPQGIVEKYNELLYHVARKFPNESRHETALRYIKNAESGEAAQAAKGEGK